MAEDEGFEPSVGCPTHAFQACAFDHSATSPVENRRRPLAGSRSVPSPQHWPRQQKTVNGKVRPPSPPSGGTSPTAPQRALHRVSLRRISSEGRAGASPGSTEGLTLDISAICANAHLLKLNRVSFLRPKTPVPCLIPSPVHCVSSP